MVASRRLLLGLGVLAASLAACDALIGLGGYSSVDCAFDCGVPDGGEGGALGETGPDDVTVDALDAGDTDATADGSETGADVGPEAQAGDGGWDGPALVQRWAQWPMPNPDAAIAPDSATLLPNQMTYDAGADGGAKTVLDTVTGLVWSRELAPQSAGTYAAAAGYCAGLGNGWHLPSRIQLVSLVDFTQTSPTVDPVTFPDTGAGRYWTSSPVPSPSDGGSQAFYWTVDFGTGLTTISASAQYARCVYEP